MKLRDEFAKKCKRKATILQDIRQLVEDRLAKMLAHNPQRMDYYRKYSEIIADYNREKDRVTIEETFARLVDLANSLDVEQRRAAEEGLSEEELALFDLLMKESLTKADRERVKQASRSLLASIQRSRRWNAGRIRSKPRPKSKCSFSTRCSLHSQHLLSRTKRSKQSQNVSTSTSGNRLLHRRRPRLSRGTWLLSCANLRSNHSCASSWLGHVPPHRDMSEFARSQGKPSRFLTEKNLLNPRPIWPDSA